MIPQVTPSEVVRWRADPNRPAPLLLDVRESWELAICAIDVAAAIPLGQLTSRVGELPQDRPIVCVCHHGARSQYAAMILARAGLPHVYNLRGGVAAWADEVDPSLARY